MIKRPSSPRPHTFPSLRWFPVLAVARRSSPLRRRPSTGALQDPRPSGCGLDQRSAGRLSGAVDAGAGSGQQRDLSSGDPVADAFARKRLLDAYNIRHQIVRPGKDQAVLVIGQEEWPLPIPLVRSNNTWRFDAQVARRELVFRRIGRNEQGAIKPVSFTLKPSGNTSRRVLQGRIYAQRVISQPGEKDGLYWPALSGEDESPLGEFAATAAAEGYPIDGQRKIPYHGYNFRILTRQGPNAPGGEIDYLVHGNMVGGFALVAYPAEYRNSGLTTFLVNDRGNIYEKDLGSRTAAIASEMTSFDPDDTWRQVTQEVHSANGPR